MDSKKETKKSRHGFSGNLGFILAAAGSAVGLGNLWRFPYVAAKDGGGIFVLVYLILALTFGFTLIITEIAIGRKTQKGPVEAYNALTGNKKFSFLGWLSTIIPQIILSYYCVIGGWVLKYGAEYVTGARNVTGENAGNFFNEFITSRWAPILFFLIFLGITAVVLLFEVDKGIENVSKVLMPALLLLIIGIAIYSLTLSHTDADGVKRTALEGLKIYLVPDFKKITLGSFLQTMVDASAQIFYSLSIAMGIMIAYGSYSPKNGNIVKSVNQIEIFDAAVALIAGVIVIPSVFVFQGEAGLGKSGPSLMFISLPQVFDQMGIAGIIVGALFFLLVFFAALTSSISLMEAVVSSVIERFHMRRKAAVLSVFGIAALAGIVVCLGYNLFYFELDLPIKAIKGGQILDIFDFLCNNLLMPLVALMTCILIGWIMSPKVITDEIRIGLNSGFKREKLYNVMIKFICPILLVVILLDSFGVFGFLNK